MWLLTTFWGAFSKVGRQRKGEVELPPVARRPGPQPAALAPYLRNIRKGCTECGACTHACAFLAHHGTPKAIVAACDFTSPGHLAIAYQCSLCGLCSAVCPEGLDPSGFFLECRRLYVDGGIFSTFAYQAILGYEKCGTSSLFSWYNIPEGCDTVFFPGCGLPGTRPDATLSMFRELRKSIPSLGVVLDCCTRPSHDLGRRNYFTSAFGKLIDRLHCRGVKKVVVACPNCFQIFRQYGNGISVATVYEYLETDSHQGQALAWEGQVSVHDPCALRDETAVHQAVRRLLQGLGLKVTEMKHHGRRTVCCGHGGMVEFINPDLAGSWPAIREEETAGLPIITYCAGCTSFLNKLVPAVHIADLLYRPEKVRTGMALEARPPFTYLNRLMLKRRLQKDLSRASRGR